MKFLSFPLVFLILFFSGCKKSSAPAPANTTTGTVHYTKATRTHSSTGVIKGPSPFATACGGAYWIMIDGNNARTTFNSLPAGSGIDLTTATFPINVAVDWHYETPNMCSIIIIDAIVIR